MLVDCIYYQILYNFLIFKIKKISTIYNKRIYNAMKFFFYKFGIEIIIKYFQTNLIDNKQNTSQPA